MLRRLREAPVDIDREKIAEGMLDMFDDDERVVLRLGMLPAEKMRLLEKTLRDKFLGLAKDPANLKPEIPDFMRKVGITEGDGDKYVMILKEAPCFHEFSLNRLVSEALHEICVAIYAIGDLVV